MYAMYNLQSKFPLDNKKTEIDIEIELRHHWELGLVIWLELFLKWLNSQYR